MKKVLYLTRADIGWYSRNANAFQKPFALMQVFDLTICCPKNSHLPEELVNGCKQIIYTGRGWFRHIRDCVRTAHQVNNVECIVSGSDWASLFAGWWIKRRLDIKWCVCCWDPPGLCWRQRKSLFARTVVRGLNCCWTFFVFSSDRLILNMDQRFLESVGCHPRPGQLLNLPNGIELPKDLTFDVEGVAKDPYAVGILSRGSAEKGINVVLEAFFSLQRDYPKFKVIWVGEVSDVWRNQVEQRCKAEGVNPARFYFTGKLSRGEAFSILNQCGILLFPYQPNVGYEFIYPLKILEYMFLGGAIIATRLQGVEFYLKDEMTGLFFDGTTKELILKLKKVLEDDEFQEELGRRARSCFSLFSWKEVNVRFVRVLKFN